jgi:hypothetical protein
MSLIVVWCSQKSTENEEVDFTKTVFTGDMAISWFIQNDEVEQNGWNNETNTWMDEKPLIRIEEETPRSWETVVSGTTQ